VPCRVVDSTGTSLPDAGTPVVVGVTDERILVWGIARVPTEAGKLLGVVGRSRLLRAEIERAGARTHVRLGFEEDARLFVDAPRERHPEQLAWVLSAEPGRVGQ
jgi:enoyl-[acyl-carrier-protein] reductase (NADH)